MSYPGKKIALIGNMNNNHFSLMRYFRDLGADAHLFPFSNDGNGVLAHFSPEADTWDIEKWSSYIHEFDVPNGYSGLIFYWKKLQLPPSKRYLLKKLSEYDYIIGTGLAPAILARVNISLDIFSPYGMGIEYLGDTVTRNILENAHYVKRQVFKFTAKKQKEGVLQAKYCLNGDLGPTAETFQEIGKSFLPYTMPMVYNNDPLDRPHDLHLFHTEKIQLIQSFGFIVFSHSRQQWVHDKTFTLEEWQSMSKNNDWLLKGFARFRKKMPNLNTVLVLLEYGPDVEAAKKMCTELGINEKVIWLPKLMRKELMCYLHLCHVAAGEFYRDAGVLWGGTGWEALSAGKPLLQGNNFTEAGFQQKFGYPYPPILGVKSEDDILTHLTEMASNIEKRNKTGVASKTWFNQYNGIGLAKKWLDLLFQHDNHRDEP